MLLDKTLVAGDVITLKLTSGEEIIARYVDETSHGVKVEKPMSLAVSPQGIGMGPFVFTVNPERAVTINYSAIVMQSQTDKAMADQYLQGTTGIKLI
jgi:hypothetical protein